MASWALSNSTVSPISESLAASTSATLPSLPDRLGMRTSSQNSWTISSRWLIDGTPSSSARFAGEVRLREPITSLQLQAGATLSAEDQLLCNIRQ